MEAETDPSLHPSDHPPRNNNSDPIEQDSSTSPENVVEGKDAARLHELLLQRKDAPDDAEEVAIDMQDADLQNINLKGERNDESSHADLKNANLSEANLKGATLDFAKLNRAVLYGVDLEGATLILAKLEKASLTEANLKEANLSSAKLNGADLDHADLEGAKLRGAELKEANLQRSIFKGANLEFAYIDGANLHKADLKEAKLVLAHLEEASLTEADLAGTNLKRAKLEKATLTETILKNADLSESRLKEANLTDANLQDANLTNANLKGAVLTNANLKDANLKDIICDVFKPPMSKASRSITSWRIKTTAINTTKEMTTRCKYLFLHNDDNDDDDDSDGDSDDESTDSDGSDRNDSDEEANNGNESAHAGILDKNIGKIVDVTIHILDLIQKVDIALDRGFNFLCRLLSERSINEVGQFIKNKIPRMVLMLVASFVFDPLRGLVHGKLEIDKHGLKQSIDELVEDFRNGNQEDFQIDDISNEIDIENVEDVPRQFLDNMTSFLEHKVLDDLESKLEELTAEYHKLEVDLEEGLHDIEKILKKLQKNVKRFLHKGLQDMLSNLITGHCNEVVKGLSGKAKDSLVAAEKFEKKIFGKIQENEQKIKHFLRQGTIRSHAVKAVLNEATKYSVGGTGIGIMFASMKFSIAELRTDETELAYLQQQLERLQNQEITNLNCRDVFHTWKSVFDLRKQIRSEKGLAILDCITSDQKVLTGLGIAKTLHPAIGGGDFIQRALSDEPGRHIRENGYKYQKAIRRELIRIQNLKEYQIKFFALAGTALASVLIALFNNIFSFFGSRFTSWWHLPLIAVGFIIAVALMGALVMVCIRRSKRDGQHKKQN